jgi:hypothetical protein
VQHPLGRIVQVVELAGARGMKEQPGEHGTSGTAMKRSSRTV